MTPTVEQLAEAKRTARSTWAAGDYDTIAQPLWPAGARVVEATGVGTGDVVLDVACGTGNAAVQAATAGADVIGLDLTPELFDRARIRASAAGVEVEWREGDAESLPFDDGRFDVVLSTFGAMFAPRHAVVAGEMARVLAPGGRLGLCSWTPEGGVGDFFRTVGQHLPPPPPFAQPPLLWGTEDHVRTLFAGTGITLEFSREDVEFRFASVEEEIEHFEVRFGPLVRARELLEPQGRWQALHDDLVAQVERHLQPDGTTRSTGEYLLVVGHRDDDVDRRDASENTRIV